MVATANSRSRRLNMGLVVVALVPLLACLVYDLYLVTQSPELGLAFDARWQITAVEECDPASQACSEEVTLKVSDQMIQIGGITFQDYVNNPGLVPFSGYEPGEVVPVTVLRDGQVLELGWEIRPISLSAVARYSLLSLLVYGVFWLAGTYVLLYLGPPDLTWGLLVALYYLTTIWLAVGLFSQSNVASSALVLRVIGWLMVPVMIHLHVIAPSPLIGSRRRPLMIATYGLAMVMLGLQLTGQLPWIAYLTGIMSASLVSIGLLTLRLILRRAPAEKRTARLMLAGIMLSLGPGLLLATTPLLLNIGESNATIIALSIVAMPMLPLFYTYALYRHRLGLREQRLNHLIVRYTAFLTYLILFVLSFVFISNWIVSANEFLAILALVALSILVAWLPVRQVIQSLFDRLAYGIRYSHQDLLAEYADLIPAAVDKQDIVTLLKYKLAPQMGIRQSALYIRQGQDPLPIYLQGRGPSDGPNSWPEAQAIAHDDDHSRRAEENAQIGEEGDHLAWVQLVVPLRLRDRLTGIWLFGSRESGDMYSGDDIALLDRLSSLIAATMESSKLLDSLSQELASRQQAEARLADQSQRLALLHDIDLSILAAGSLTEIARAAVEGVYELIPCVRSSIFLFEPDKDKLKILAAKGHGTQVANTDDTLPLSALPATVETILNGEPHVIEDVQATTHQSTLLRALAKSGIRASISIPLVASDNVLGALSIASDKPESFAPTQIAVAEEVATSVALAIHSAGLRQEIEENRRQLQLLSSRLINIQEMERKWLSHELHDEMGQILTGISFNLAAIEKSLPNAGNDALKSQLQEATAFVDMLTDQVRSLSLELRPTMLHDLGLESALRWYVSNYVRKSGIEVEFETSGWTNRLPEEVEITCYRIVQEALTNVGRHAEANMVNLRVERQGDLLRTTIEDDGRGFDPEIGTDGESAPSGVGLVMMRERIQALNGHLLVDSRPGVGTCVVADIPIGKNR